VLSVLLEKKSQENQINCLNLPLTLQAVKGKVPKELNKLSDLYLGDR
jgi:hypothetical protein